MDAASKTPYRYPRSTASRPDPCFRRNGSVLAGLSIEPADMTLWPDFQRRPDHGVLIGPLANWPLLFGPVLSDLQLRSNQAVLPQNTVDAVGCGRNFRQGNFTSMLALPRQDPAIIRLIRGTS